MKIFQGIVTQIKRSIPDLRSIKHQPLENCSGKETRLNTNFNAECLLSFSLFIYLMFIFTETSPALHLIIILLFSQPKKKLFAYDFPIFTQIMTLKRVNSQA